MMDQVFDIINNPVIILVWKILSMVWTGIAALFLFLMTRFLNHFSRMLKHISDMQRELAIQGQAIKSVTERVEDHDNRLWELANGQRNRRGK